MKRETKRIILASLPVIAAIVAAVTVLFYGLSAKADGHYGSVEDSVVIVGPSDTGPPVLIVFQTRVYDLRKPDEFMEAHNAMLDVKIDNACRLKALMAIGMMDDRDKGLRTEEDHMHMLEERMVNTKEKYPHVYTDMQRIVRDVHRTNASGSYYFTDRVVFFRRELMWCNPNITLPSQ